MVNLVIDFGNTRTKAAIFEGDNITFKADDLSPDEIKNLIKKYSPAHCIVSSVSTSKSEIVRMLGSDILFLSHKTSLPYTSTYKTPHTLGLDRIAAVAGAQYLHPNKNCLVIDAGTCITYDILDQEGVHHGGAISPGLSMRFKALNTFTANLPLVNRVEDTPLTGQSTDEAIKSGVIYGIVAEIEGFIRMYKDKFADLQIIICGGDAKFFDNKLKGGIFATPELVLTGLNRILQYNV